MKLTMVIIKYHISTSLSLCDSPKVLLVGSHLLDLLLQIESVSVGI